MAIRLKGFVMNVVKFHTKAYELNRKTQTSRVLVNAKTLSYSSSKDKNLIKDSLTHIVELDYYENHKIVLFRCDLMDIDKAKVLVNAKTLSYSSSKDKNLIKE
ncbi:hypothetical protein CDL12_18433 [Handroanthus impetiginosus]|uniref:Uncharacterized protein n=1 Tax=Handroanthus impetiginosus TaxID=429701 RepID=A0A2G9GUN2_9LAMI|nr:hypothetical protein CDL12_18433 [Handroanthus impetiginosus]